MNALRIRVVKLRDDVNSGGKRPFAVQASQDSLNWWTVLRGDSEDDMVAMAKGMVKFAEINMLVKEESIIWQTKN